MIIERLDAIFSKFIGLNGFELVIILLLILIGIVLILKGVKK